MPKSCRLLPSVVVLVLSGIVPGRLSAQTAEYERVRAYVDGHRHEIVAELVELLKLPNVAADLPGIRRNAAALRAAMECRGIRTRLLETGGAPLVYGELEVPGATRTILFYAHYDGQPVDTTRWVGHRPFEPVLRAGRLEEAPGILPFPEPGGTYDPDWRLYARSASDDKAPIVAMLAALDALEAAGLRPRAHLKFLLEGDEEAGSPNLERVLREHARLLDADLAVIADGPQHPSGRPTVVFGARGIVSVELTVYGAVRPLHSGHYGNWAPNPAERLAELLATMQDESGRVTIEGWYDDVMPIGPEERAALAALGAMPEDGVERRRLGIMEPEGQGRSRWEMVLQPSLNVNGLRSGWVGAEARTIVPDVAVASLDLRVVADVRPERQVRRLIEHLRGLGYHVVSEEPDPETRLAHPRLVRVAATDGYPAVRTPMSHPAASALLREVRAAAHGDVVAIPTMGGSVPGYVFPEILGATFVSLPIVNPDNNQHSPNENLRLGHLFEGIVLMAAAMRTDPRPASPTTDAEAAPR